MPLLDAQLQAMKKTSEKQQHWTKQWHQLFHCHTSLSLKITKVILSNHWWLSETAVSLPHALLSLKTAEISTQPLPNISHILTHSFLTLKTQSPVIIQNIFIPHTLKTQSPITHVYKSLKTYLFFACSKLSTSFPKNNNQWIHTKLIHNKNKINSISTAFKDDSSVEHTKIIQLLKPVQNNKVIIHKSKNNTQ